MTFFFTQNCFECLHEVAQYLLEMNIGKAQYARLPQITRQYLESGRLSDVYFQGDYFQSLNSTSREVSFKQVHAWQGSSLVPIFEFHDKRHFMEFYLNFKVPFPNGFSKWGSRVPCISIMETIMPKTLMPLEKSMKVRRRPRRLQPWSGMP